MTAWTCWRSTRASSTGSCPKPRSLQFVQVENKVQALLDVAAAATIPIVTETPGTRSKDEGLPRRLRPGSLATQTTQDAAAGAAAGTDASPRKWAGVFYDPAPKVGPLPRINENGRPDVLPLWMANW